MIMKMTMMRMTMMRMTRRMGMMTIMMATKNKKTNKKQ